MDASRRSIIKGAAWSVPAILSVGAAPAFATSAPVCIPAKIKRVTAGEAKVNVGTAKKPKYEIRDTVKINFASGSVADVTVLFNGVPGYVYFKDGFISTVKQNTKKDRLVQIKSCGKIVWSGRIGHDC